MKGATRVRVCVFSFTRRRQRLRAFERIAGEKRIFCPITTSAWRGGVREIRGENSGRSALRLSSQTHSSRSMRRRLDSEMFYVTVALKQFKAMEILASLRPPRVKVTFDVHTSREQPTKCVSSQCLWSSCGNSLRKIAKRSSLLLSVPQRRPQLN